MRERAISATVWSAADIFLRQGVQFVVSIVLARLLTPSDFGTIALLHLFAGIAAAFAAGGLTFALVQRQNVTLEDESTVFWLNMIVGALMAVLLWLSGPAISVLYDMPVLTPLAGLMAVTVVVTAAGGIQHALFAKALNFRPVMLAGVVSAVASGGAAICLALAGYGVWALAAQALISAIAVTVVLWSMSSWRPMGVLKLASARSLFGFGGYLLASSLLEITYTRLYAALIGRLYGLIELGFYARADATAQFPSNILNGIVGRVALPLFSRIADDPGKLRSNLGLALQCGMLFNAPAMLGLAAVAEPLVLVLFGEQWLEAVPFLQVLCLAGLLMPMHVFNLHALMALGRSDLFFRLELMKKSISIIILFAFAAFGALAIAWGMVLASLISYFINAHYSGKLLRYSAAAQLRDTGPIIGAAAAMAVSVTGLGMHIHGWSNPSLELLLLVAAGAMVYLLIVALLRPPGLTLLLSRFRGARAVMPGSET